VVADLIARRRRFFLFPLQLDTDSQVRQHSQFGRLTAAIETVIDSFMRDGDGSTALVVKNHPLDNGWINYRRLVERLAREGGAAERIRFIDGGDLVTLIDHAAGIVTINSTVGLTALERGRPVIALGEAVFRLPGLTFQQDIAAFWRDPMPPDMELLAAFRRVLLDICLVNGNFYTEAGLDLAIANSMPHLTGENA
jgi:capsular polysaccharide export protein